MIVRQPGNPGDLPSINRLRRLVVACAPAPPDRWAIGLVLLFTVLAVSVGLSTGYRTVDIDELVFVRTLTAMHHGAGYYNAMRHALILKDGAPPSQIRSVRPPTMFLLLAKLPPTSWRWAVGAVYLAILACAWRLGRLRSPTGGAIAVCLVGMWLLGAAPLLFLHAELWGLPFAMAGVLAAKRERWAVAAVSIGAAVAFRELYGALFLFGFLLAPKRRPWLVVGLCLVALGLIHVHYASSILSAHGREASFGNDTRDLAHALTSISPSGSTLGWTIGLLTTIGGVGALNSGLRTSRRNADSMVLGFGFVMIPFTIVFGRVYWDLTYGPLLASFAPAFPIPERLSRHWVQHENRATPNF
jgi:hypothetical protein